MIKTLLSHHIARASDGVPYSALHNCHATGLTSIVLNDEPGNRIRLFIAAYHHTLWQFNPSTRANPAGVVPLAIHPHHCDVRFVGILGRAQNIVFALTPTAKGGWQEFRYRSPITSGDAGAFEPTKKRAVLHEIRRNDMADCPALAAHELHTVFVPMQELAAWLVIEGRQDPDYTGLCWSNGEPTFPADAYRPMPSEDVAATLQTLLGRLP